MIAIEITSFGAPNVLKAVERPDPKPAAGELVIGVQAAGVSRADIMQRQGKYPPPPGAPDIPGLDVAGTVHSVGTGVTAFRPGDAVCAIVSGGGYAEYCAVPSVQTLPLPARWTPIEAATLPENLFTVFDNLVTRAELKQGETVLIHGGASGIGTTAIMLARAWEGTVIVTAGSTAKCDACLDLGAQHAIAYKESDFVAEVKRITNGRGVDIVVDLVGGAYLERNLDVLGTEGRLAILATQGGRTGTLDIGKLMVKRGRVIGSTMRARSASQKGEIAERLLRQVWPLLPAKHPIRPVIDTTFPLRDARLAHERLESGQHIGKIVLTI